MNMPIRIMFKILLPVALLCGLYGCATTPQRPEIIEKGNYQAVKEYLSKRIEKEMRDHDVQGLSIALVDDDKVIWTQGFGMARDGGSATVTERTLFRLGSISELFTATEAMRLHQEGQIDIDKNIDTYLPRFLPKNRFVDKQPISIRSLLSHHSGLPSNWLNGMWAVNGENIGSLAGLIEQSQLVNLTNPPDSIYKHSNLGYSVLGRLIEVIELGAFAPTMEARLLKPLGMIDSSFDLLPDMYDLLAMGYEDGRSTTLVPMRDKPAVSMWSNADDMAEFLKVVFAGGRVGDKQFLDSLILDEMFNPQFVELPLNFGHKVGLGWFLSGLDLPNGDVVAWQQGSTGAYRTHLSVIPEQKLGIVILSNSSSASDFIAQLGVEALKLTLETKTGERLPNDPPLPEPEIFEMAGEQLDLYTGFYTVFGEFTEITRNDKTLQMELWGETVEWVPVAIDTFVPAFGSAFNSDVWRRRLSLHFKKAEGMDVAVLRGMPTPSVFLKVRHYDVLPVAWERRLGEYQLETGTEQLEIDAFGLKWEDRTLLADYKIASEIPGLKSVRKRVALYPISDKAALVLGLGNGEGGIVSVVKSAQGEKLFFSGYELTQMSN